MRPCESTPNAPNLADLGRKAFALGPKSGHGNCVRIRKKIVSRPPPVGATLVVGGNGHAPVFRVSSPESACRPPFRLLSAAEQRRCGAAVPGPRPGLESAPEHQVSSVASKGSATAIHIMRRSAGWHPATHCRDAVRRSALAGHWRVPAASRVRGAAVIESLPWRWRCAADHWVGEAPYGGRRQEGKNLMREGGHRRTSS